MPSPNNSPNSRLFVGGLPYSFTEGELLALFIPFGRVIAVKIMHTQWGKSRGLGFVEFDNLESAIAAKTKMHNYQVDLDRTIIVDYAAPDPFNTPEGKERHQQAVVAKEKRYSKFAKNAPSSEVPSPKTFGKKIIKPVFGSTRQSVYDSRTHHSQVGAKFAKRNKK
jgi:RNA recognition motif-containing protein